MEPSLILVGIDFSDASAVAAGWARDLAARVDGRLLAVHVAPGDEWRWTPERLRWLDRIGFATAAVTVRTGTPWLQLARFADDVRPTLLVVGSHGEGGFHPVAPGSTATMLLTRVRVPVVVVPAGRSPAGTQPESSGGAMTPPSPPDAGRSSITESIRS